MRNIILTGFMGTGKSTVGVLLAQRLQRQFIDMDTLLEQRQGLTINQLFTQHGEPYFRQLEAALCHELAQRQDLVIATGGGALVPETNLRALMHTGQVICLDCEPETLWQRIGQSHNRPMLQTPEEDRFQRLSTLLAQRQAAYARVPYHVEVTHLSPEEVVEAIIKLRGKDYPNG